MCSCIHIIAEKASFLEELLPTLVGTILGGGISVGLAVYLFREENKRDNLIREQENSSQSELRKAAFLLVLTASAFLFARVIQASS
jgi:hypothetical protein